MALDGIVVERVRIVALDEHVTQPYEKGDSRYAVVVEAAGMTGCYGPVDELPAALVATSLGQAAVGHRVADDGLAYRLLDGGPGRPRPRGSSAGARETRARRPATS